MIRTFDQDGGSAPEPKVKESPFEVGFSDDGKKVLLAFPGVAIVEFTIEGAKQLKKTLGEMIGDK